jgi:hypothetical protein
MIQGAEIAATLIYLIPAGVNFFFSGKPMISFTYAIIDIRCLYDDQGLLNPCNMVIKNAQFTLSGIAIVVLWRRDHIDSLACVCYAEAKKYNGRFHVHTCPLWRFS